MKRFILILLAFILVYATNVIPAIAAFIDFDRVTTYRDGSSISDTKIPTIQYQAYYGSSSTGPWTAGNIVVDNVTITAPDPAAGSTLWYTVDASLDGAVSFKAAAKSKTVPFPQLNPPVLRGVR